MRRGEVEYLYGVLVFGEPYGHVFAVVRSQVVQNEIHFPFGILNETPHEVNKPGGIHGFSIEGESDFSFIVDS